MSPWGDFSGWCIPFLNQNVPLPSALRCPNTQGQDAVGQDAVGQVAVGLEAVRRDAVGRDAVGRDAVRRDAVRLAELLETFLKWTCDLESRSRLYLIASGASFFLHQPLSHSRWMNLHADKRFGSVAHPFRSRSCLESQWSQSKVVPYRAAVSRHSKTNGRFMFDPPPLAAALWYALCQLSLKWPLIITELQALMSSCMGVCLCVLKLSP